MPAAAVVAGAFTAAGAAAGASALIGGTITMATVASGLAFVGGVATALGGLTGNKKLMKFGMITGLAGAAVGGIASLTNSAADAAANAGANTAASVSEAVAANADALTIPTVSDIATGVATGQDLTSPFMVTGNQVPSGAGLLGSSSQQAVADAAANSSAASSVAANSAAANSAAANSAAANSTISANFAPSASSLMDQAASPFKKFAQLPSIGTGAGMFGNFGQFLQKNPELVKAGTGILSGIGQASMQQELMDWKERMDAERRARINASIMGQKSNY